jgi:hypothetical protein
VRVVTRRYEGALTPYRNHDAGAPGSSATNVERSIVVSSNSTLEDEIRGALERDPRIPSPDEIAVSAVDGDVVLRGTVSGFGQRRAAVGDARNADCVEDIDDQLQVRILDDERRADADIPGSRFRSFTGMPRFRRTSSTSRSAMAG